MRALALLLLPFIALLPAAAPAGAYVAYAGIGSGQQHYDQIAPNPAGDRTCSMQVMTLELRWSLWSSDGWDMSWTGSGGCLADFNTWSDLKGDEATGFTGGATVKENGVDCYIYTVRIGPIGPATSLFYEYQDLCGPGRYVRTTTGTFFMS